MSTILDKVNGPEDVKELPLEELPQLAEDIRDRIVTVMPVNGGHFAPSLGVTELTIALHRVFGPDDKIIFDVSHQCYPHKMLTGRRDWYRQIRLKGGPAGYTNPKESNHDWFTWAHAGTSISTALGLARAAHGEDSWAIAVIGDASIPTGVSMEALNHSGILKDEKLIIILNDNGMSIAPTVGALSHHLRGVRQEARESGRAADGEGENSDLGSFFEAYGQRYMGPFDGHDVFGLVDLLQRIKDGGRGAFVHLETVKGKGHTEAEKDPWKWHAVGGAKTPGPKKVEYERIGSTPYTSVFADTCVQRARRDPDFQCLTAAMPCGTGLKKYAAEFPDRFYDTGIAEQHAVAFATGLCKGGKNVVAAIYSTFLQRAYDQLFQEISLNETPVVFCMDRAGIVGPDGATHNGCFDIAYMRSFPHIMIMAPADATELGDMINLSLDLRQPCAIRYPRTAAPDQAMEYPREAALEPGRSDTLRQGGDIAILAYGSMVYPSMEAAEILEKQGIEATVVNARFVRPFDQDMLQEVLRTHPVVLTVEEHNLNGGFGSACLETASKNRWATDRIVTFGIDDQFVAHGTRQECLEEMGLDPKGIAQRAREALEGHREHDPLIPEQESEAY